MERARDCADGERRDDGGAADAGDEDELRVFHNGVLDQLDVDVGDGSEPAEEWGKENFGVVEVLYTT